MELCLAVLLHKCQIVRSRIEVDVIELDEIPLQTLVAVGFDLFRKVVELLLVVPLEIQDHIQPQIFAGSLHGDVHVLVNFGRNDSAVCEDLRCVLWRVFCENRRVKSHVVFNLAPDIVGFF